MKKKECVIFQKVASYEECKILAKNHILPIAVVVNYSESVNLSKKFKSLYSLEWFSIGSKSDEIYYSLNGIKLLKLFDDKILKPKYILFSDNSFKKIDSLYPIQLKINKNLEIRKAKLERLNKLDDKCLISCSSDLWHENDYYKFGTISLSEEAIKVYKRKHK